MYYEKHMFYSETLIYVVLANEKSSSEWDIIRME